MTSLEVRAAWAIAFATTLPPTNTTETKKRRPKAAFLIALTQTPALS
jgi:hypothetical protein